MYIM